jgi:hypothetical protein
MSGVALGIIGLFGPVVLLIIIVGVCEFMGWGERWLEPRDGEDQ